MAQITGAISSKEYKIETSPDGSAWTDRSGAAVKITQSEGGRRVGQKNTFDGDTPIVTAGKRQAVRLMVEFVYTEGASDLFDDVEALFVAGSDLYVRWSPKGGQTGEFQFTSLAGKIENFKYPDGDAESGDPIIGSFELVTPGLTKATVA